MQRLTLFLLFTISNAPAIAQTVFSDVTHQLPNSATGGNTMDIQAADLNGDGHLDIVLAKEWQRNRVLFNDGTGNFTDATIGRLSNVSHDSEDIAIADFDGDGWLDIVFASEDDATHEFYLNTGFGNFVDVSTRLPQFVANAVVATDINGDSYIDLIFGNAGQNRIFINDGSGNFTDETSTRMPSINDITQDILLVDVDNDGDWDLAVANEDGNRLLINNGSGIFSDETATKLASTVNMESRKVSKSDINNDGYDDLFFSNMASVPGKDIQDRLYLNDGSGHFTDVSSTHLPYTLKHTFDAVFNNFNEDNNPDLIVAYMSDGRPSVILNDGTGNYTDHTNDYLPSETAGKNIAVYVADFNNDGKNDIYLGRFQQEDGLFFANMATSMQKILANNVFCIYPNPTKNSLTLKIHESWLNDNISIQVSDINGKTFFSQRSKNAKYITIPTTLFASGTYLLTVITPIGKTSSLFEVKA